MSAGDASDDIVSGGTVVARTRREEASRESVERALRQRVRELDALRRIAALLVEDGPLEARFDPLVAILAGATQYPESTTAACFHRGRFFASPGHTRTPWVLTATVPSPRGVTTLELAYHSPKPEAAFGPFLAEERTLLDVIADLVRTAIERRDAQVALRETLDRMDHAFSAARMGVWELEIGTRTTRWSSQLSQMTGLAGPPVGPLWSRADLVHPDDIPIVVGQVQRVMAGAEVRAFELRLKRPDGEWRRMSTSVLLVRSKDGKPERIIAALRDVTEQRAIEEGLRQAQKVEALGQVAAGVAHDFNNLLMIMMSGAAYLVDELPEGKSRKVAADLLDASERGAALTKQLLAFSRRASFNPVALDLADLVLRLEPLLVRMAGRGVVLQVSNDGLDGRVWADPTQVEQLIMNLVLNARDAMPHGGTITLRTHLSVVQDFEASSDSFAVLEVGDTGVGIPSDLRARIFEPFFTTKEPGKGTGLGLAVVTSVVRQWQGRVEVDSVVGEGTTFRVLLPLMK
ncbi:MAG: PAS domain-containing protein [Deltaproteobacteria bacterium]|nr:PAS domain-containing protein [Deltaproteobacteria bacterium]